MAKISEEMRLHFNEVIIPYKEKISALLAKEKTMLNGMHKGDIDLENKKILLCEDMIYISTLYMAQNSLSLKVLGVKNNDALNDARKVLYKAIIYMEEIVTDKIDVPYLDLTENLEKVKNISISRRFMLIKKLGLAISMLKEAFGENSKWKLSFVELEGRFATIAKNLLDMRECVKYYFDPSSENYELVALYIRLIEKLLKDSANAYRNKYETSSRRIDDMRNGIKLSGSDRKVEMTIGKTDLADEVKRRALVWKDKMDSDHKNGLSN